MTTEDKKTILVKKEEVHDRRLQRILDKHEGEPFIPLGDMMVTHLEFVRERDRQNNLAQEEASTEKEK